MRPGPRRDHPPEPDVFQPLHRRSGRNRRLQREADRADRRSGRRNGSRRRCRKAASSASTAAPAPTRCSRSRSAWTARNGPFVVAAQIALDGLASVVGSMESSTAASVTVVDGSNVILFQRPDDVTVGRVATNSGWFAELRRSGSQAVVVTKGPDGVRRIYTGERLSDPAGAVALAGIPTKVAYAEPAHWLRVRVRRAADRDPDRAGDRARVRAHLRDPPHPRARHHDPSDRRRRPERPVGRAHERRDRRARPLPRLDGGRAPRARGASARTCSARSSKRAKRNASASPATCTTTRSR